MKAPESIRGGQPTKDAVNIGDIVEKRIGSEIPEMTGLLGKVSCARGVKFGCGASCGCLLKMYEHSRY